MAIDLVKFNFYHKIVKNEPKHSLDLSYRFNQKLSKNATPFYFLNSFLLFSKNTNFFL